jgi:hypothetical protein
VVAEVEARHDVDVVMVMVMMLSLESGLISTGL